VKKSIRELKNKGKIIKDMGGYDITDSRIFESISGFDALVESISKNGHSQ